MIKRKIEKELESFLEKKEKKALLITGARQVGKTCIIRAVGQRICHRPLEHHSTQRCM